MKKTTKLTTEIENSKCLYKKRKIRSFLDLLTAYQKGKLNKYNFIAETQKKYNILFELQKILKERNINSLTIENDAVIFNLKESNLQFAVDKSCRSALFELLNFGSYEHDEMQMLKNLIGKSSVMLDVGSHLGWYSIILANYYRDAQFYAFEPVPNTYTILKKNISMNKLTNIQAFNFGFSDEEKLAKFYYSEIGSAVASERDIFDIRTLDTIECDLKKLDDFVTNEKKIKKIDFIKCDVEGAEFLVIKGGEKSIRKFLPILFLELVEDWCNKFGYTISNVLSFLSELGYKIFEIKGEFLYPIDKITPNKIDNFNYLFLHENKHKAFIDKYMFQK